VALAHDQYSLTPDEQELAAKRNIEAKDVDVPATEVEPTTSEPEKAWLST
jgi:hypothetical protein